jgi:hypothetical protein
MWSVGKTGGILAAIAAPGVRMGSVRRLMSCTRKPCSARTRNLGGRGSNDEAGGHAVAVRFGAKSLMAKIAETVIHTAKIVAPTAASTVTSPPG